MANIFKGNEILKGIVFGLLSLFILEFGSMVVIAGFNNVHIWYYSDPPYYLLYAFNAIIAVLLGIGVAKKIALLQGLLIY
jgi:hypothetical protein